MPVRISWYTIFRPLEERYNIIGSHHILCWPLALKWKARAGDREEMPSVMLIEFNLIGCLVKVFVVNYCKITYKVRLSTNLGQDEGCNHIAIIYEMLYLILVRKSPMLARHSGIQGHSSVAS